MKLLYIILTFNRPNITQQCLTTLFNNTSVRPDEVWILDDCSDPQMAEGLSKIGLNSRGSPFPINTTQYNKNYGVGWNFEMAYNIVRMKSPEIVCFIESDYIFRKGWMEDVQAVFRAAPHTIMIPGVDHPDMYDRNKTHNEFCKLMVDQFGEDVEARQHMYAPFQLDTEVGNIKVQGVSNSCGCMILHWGRIQSMIKSLNIEQEYWRWMERGFHKHGGERRFASDAHMSGTPTYYWEKWAKGRGLDLSKTFAALDICDYSISEHICGGGINGMIAPEGFTFVSSPNWKQEFLVKNPREKV